MNHTPFKTQVSPWLPRKTRRCPASGGQLAARLLTVLPGCLENLFGRSWTKPFLLHLFVAGLLVLCFRSDSGSRGLHTIYTVSTTDLTTSGDREKFSTIPFPGKTETAKRCLSGIEKCSYAKAKLCCNERTWWPSCKTYSHLDPQSRGPFDARTVS